MLATTAQKFGSNGKSFKAPSAVAPTIGAALLASGTSDTADTAWSPSAACLLPDILPVAGTLLSYGGSRQLAAGGTVTHSGALTLGGALTLPGNPSSALHAAPKQYVDSAVGAIDLSGLVPYTGATGAVNLGSNTFTSGAITSPSISASSGNTSIGTSSGKVIVGSWLEIYPWSTNNVVFNPVVSSGALDFGRSGGAGTWLRVGFQNPVHVGSAYSLGFTSVNAWDAIDAGWVRGAAGVVARRNGLNAQCDLINKSYTSDTSQEALMLDAGKQISGKLGLYSYRGSSGGSNYPIQIGMLAADGTTFSGLTIATDGKPSASAIAANHISSNGNGYVLFGNLAGNRGLQLFDSGQGASTTQTWALSWSSTDNTSSTKTAKFGRLLNATPICVWADEGFKVRNYADSADAALTCGAITASGRGIFGGATPVAGIDSAAFPLVSNFGVMANAYSRYSAYMYIEGTGGAAFAAYDYAGSSYLPVSLIGSVVGSYANSGFKIRNLADSADAALTCGAITASGDITVNKVGGSSLAALWLAPATNYSSSVYFGGNSGDYSNRITRDGNSFDLSVIAYGSLSHITTTGSILLQSGTHIVQQRNGLNPQTDQLFSTYTSATSFACLDQRANAGGTAYEISSFKGSAGGSNLPINIGHRDSAGTFTSALSVATSGFVTVGTNASVGYLAKIYGNGLYLGDSTTVERTRIWTSGSYQITTALYGEAFTTNFGQYIPNGYYKTECTHNSTRGFIFSIDSDNNGTDSGFYITSNIASGSFNGTNHIFAVSETGAITASGNLTLSDTNLITGTATGTIIATANSQKLGFWGATPIVQPTTAVAAATLVSNGGTTLTDTDLFDGYTLKQIVKALRVAGLLA